MDTRAIIVREIELVATEQKRTLAPLTDELVLLDCGLDSLSFAILVARLEDAMGFDPFAADEDFAFPVTLGDFVTFYDRAPVA
ncbi:acyl carrier protein [Caulobacter sp. S45]|uniref:acyl carrier protein n=1 Tax=Caulobacter sp. S45 TaxID=1641861 RepID=UPI00131B7917|nr:acyl carrier protein [Caulobacter sp. S45]